MSQYSTIDAEMLCRKCQYGGVREGNQGQTLVLCNIGESPIILQFVVTKCTDFHNKETARMYSKVPEMRLTAEGGLEVRVWVDNRNIWMPTKEARQKGLV